MAFLVALDFRGATEDRNNEHKIYSKYNKNVLDCDFFLFDLFLFPLKTGDFGVVDELVVSLIKSITIYRKAMYNGHKMQPKRRQNIPFFLLLL